MHNDNDEKPNFVPEDTIGEKYNQIAHWWVGQMQDSQYGLAYLNKALDIAKPQPSILDIGCGGNGRFLQACLPNASKVTGLDASIEMITLARAQYPAVNFIHADFNHWAAMERFDFIIAWDSLFHAPKPLQAPLTQKMCSLLNENGVLLFTAGGIDGERNGEIAKVHFAYASLSYLDYLQIMHEAGCKTVLMESDQLPYDHMVFISQKM